MKTDSEGKTCPLCIENGMMSTIVWEDDEAYLCKRVDFSTGTAQVMENEYMFVPKNHTTSEPSWLSTKIEQVLQQLNIKPDTDYVNRSAEYGRLLEHFHRHYIVRDDPFRLGLNGMIALAAEQQQEIAVLKTENTRLRRARASEHLGKIGARLTGS